jgi:hypothetical protein
MSTDSINYTYISFSFFVNTLEGVFVFEAPSFTSHYNHCVRVWQGPIRPGLVV